MKPNARTEEDLDRLLRSALADDIPPEVAAGMRRRIVAFRAGMKKEKESPAGGTWILSRGLWATLAVLMLIAGGLLQGFQSRSALAERIALLKAEASKAEPAERTSTPEKRPALTPETKETRS